MTTFLALSSYLAMCVMLGAFVGVVLTQGITEYKRDNLIYSRMAVCSTAYALISIIIFLLL